MTSAVHPYHEFHDKFLSSEELEVVNAKLVERAQVKYFLKLNILTSIYVKFKSALNSEYHCNNGAT